MILVAVIHQLFDTRLNDGLGALVAGEQGDVNPGALEVVVGAVEDGVELGMADVHVFGLQRIAFPVPGHGVVVAAGGHAVVAQREDFVLGADDAGPHLAVGVLGAHGAEHGDAHKIFVPVDVVAAFHSNGTGGAQGSRAPCRKLLSGQSFRRSAQFRRQNFFAKAPPVSTGSPETGPAGRFRA